MVEVGRLLYRVIYIRRIEEESLDESFVVVSRGFSNLDAFTILFWLLNSLYMVCVRRCADAILNCRT